MFKVVKKVVIIRRCGTIVSETLYYSPESIEQGCEHPIGLFEPQQSAFKPKFWQENGENW